MQARSCRAKLRSGAHQKACRQLESTSQTRKLLADELAPYQGLFAASYIIL